MPTLDKFVTRKRQSISKIREDVIIEDSKASLPKVPKGMVYSHSRLSCFEQCPHKFRLKYIDKKTPEVEQTVETFMGSLVHEALEKLYRDLRFKKVVSVEELLEFYLSQWEKNWNPGIVIVRKEYGPENFRKMGEDYIRTYYRRFHPFDDSSTIDLEQRVMVRLDSEGKYMLQGFIDRLSQDGNGNYEIHDYKTSMHLKPQEELETDRQLALYALAVRQMFPDARKIKQVWHFLAHDKHMAVEKTADELEKLKAETIALIQQIESEIVFPINKTPLCDWCEYREYCPEFGHIARTENMPANEFLNEPGVKLVNRYAELMEKKRLAEKDIEENMGQELEKIKEALVLLAEKENVNVINGSSNTAKVWVKECYRFPKKGEPGREELEKILRQSGLWEHASSMDAFELSRLMDSPPPGWPTSIVESIRKLGSRERVERIYLSQRDADKAE